MPSSVSGLANTLRERITKIGPITVAEFMATALSHPQRGYYMTRDPFGRSGDFITAPEVSQIFGELIGLWTATVWKIIEKPKNIRLIELGPGRGTLMADALRAIHQTIPEFFETLDIDLVEISPVLRKQQQDSLQTWRKHVNINWHDTVDSIPEAPCIVIANEFFDALPIHQYERFTDGWCERLVSLDEKDNFCFERSRILADDSIIPEQFHHKPIGQIFESNPSSLNVVQSLCDRLISEKGVCLIIDYGHAKQGLGETLQAVKDQNYQDVLSDPGEADLTAHVDFEAINIAAKNKGCRVFETKTQQDFLKRLGILERAAKLLAGAAPNQAKDIQQALDRLIGNDQMGTLFKVICFADPSVDSLPGFE